MGNSCYANATLQALFVLPEIWKPIPSDHVAQVPLLRAFFATMLSLNTGKGVIRPNQFLSQLGSYISKTRRVPFRVNAQQDVCEVLGYILQELISSPNMSPEILTTRLTKTVTCNSCVEPSTSEEAYIMLSTDMATSVATSIKKFMEGEFLSFTCIDTYGRRVFIIHLYRYFMQQHRWAPGKCLYFASRGLDNSGQALRL